MMDLFRMQRLWTMWRPRIVINNEHHFPPFDLVL